MFYKFVGGDEPALLDIFDKAVENGSLKFTSALGFNDPFEFKFNSIAPTREAFDAWHKTYDPGRSADELEHGWASFFGKSADWNTNFVPRQNLLHQLYVLCLARRWDSHLMWAHYARNHQGYALIYRPEIVEAVEALADHTGTGDIDYGTQLPSLRWFQVTREEMLEPVLFTKSEEWAYEREFRLILSGPPSKPALYERVDPDLVAGVILGTRAPKTVIDAALAVQRRRPNFIVRKVTSTSCSYALDAYDVDANSWRYGHML